MPEIPWTAFQFLAMMMPMTKDGTVGGAFVFWQAGPTPAMMMPAVCAGPAGTANLDAANSGMYQALPYVVPFPQTQPQHAAGDMAPPAQQVRHEAVFTAPAQQCFGPAFPQQAALPLPVSQTCDEAFAAPQQTRCAAAAPQAPQASCGAVPSQVRAPACGLPVPEDVPEAPPDAAVAQAAEPQRASHATLQRRLRRQRAAQAARETAAPEARPARGDGSEADRCSALQERLEAGSALRASALRELRGAVLAQSFQSSGCRVVQTALDLCSIDEAAELAMELRGHVREACEHRHANFVVAKVVEVLPAEHATFVAQELRAFAAAGVRHKFCCRIFCRLIEHASTHPEVAALIEETARQAQELAKHEFAHFVIAHVLEHGLRQHRAIAVASLVRADLGALALHRYGRFGVEALFRHATRHDHAVALEQLCGQNDIVELARHEFGHTAVVAVLQSPAGAKLAEELLGASAELLENKFGQRVLHEAGRLLRLGEA